MFLSSYLILFGMDEKSVNLRKIAFADKRKGPKGKL